MREIAAASDFDFVAAEPRRAKSAAPKRGKGKKKPVRAALSWLAALRRFGTPFLAVVALIGLLTAVAVNAMYLQHGRHPAPLFGATFKIETPKPPPRPAHLDFLLGEKLPSHTPAPASATDAAFAPAPSAAAREVAPESRLKLSLSRLSLQRLPPNRSPRRFTPNPPLRLSTPNPRSLRLLKATTRSAR